MEKQWKQCQTLFFGAPKSLQMVTAAMKLKDIAFSLLLATLVAGSGLIDQKKAGRRGFLWPLKDSQAFSWGVEEAERWASLSDHVSDAWTWCCGSILARTRGGQHPGCVLTSAASPATLGLLCIFHSLPTPTARARA